MLERYTTTEFSTIMIKTLSNYITLLELFMLPNNVTA